MFWTCLLELRSLTSLEISTGPATRLSTRVPGPPACGLVLGSLGLVLGLLGLVWTAGLLSRMSVDMKITAT